MFKRTPNRLKFSMVMKDTAKIEGTMRCTDEQWDAMFLILIGKVPPDVVKRAEAEGKADNATSGSDA